MAGEVEASRAAHGSRRLDGPQVRVLKTAAAWPGFVHDTCTVLVHGDAVEIDGGELGDPQGAGL